MQARNEIQEHGLYLRQYALDFRGHVCHTVAVYCSEKKPNEANKLFADSVENLMNDEQVVSVKYTTLKDLIDNHSYIEFNFGNKSWLLSSLRKILTETNIENLYQYDLQNVQRTQADLTYENQILHTQVERKDDKHNKVLAYEKESLLKKIEELQVVTVRLQAISHRLQECNGELSDALALKDRSMQAISDEIKSLMQLANEQQTTQFTLEGEIIKLRAQLAEQTTPTKTESPVPRSQHSPTLFKPRSGNTAVTSGATPLSSSYSNGFGQ